jgi:glycosyltransferase involved in cell wall biosynthesis
MNVSIVIPVYNEADQLAACLEAIGAQTVKPLEVIVVDNNSTDNTTEVAAQFGFVKLLSEPRQGVVHARSRGFNAARGDIIARLDGDTILPPEWVAQVLRIMSDRSVTAVSGAPDYHDFALPGVANAIDRYWRQRLVRGLGDRNFLYGANMALRRSAWLKVRSRLCHQRGLHEDFDLGIHLQELGYKVIYEPALVAGVSARRINSGLFAYMRYTLVSPHTYARHSIKARRHMYPVIAVCWACWLPGHLLNKAYDPATKSFSINQLFLSTVNSRVNPAFHVL